MGLTIVQVHSYRSYVDLQTDSNAGLIGPQIVYAQGQMASTMANYREIPLLYMIYSESNSWLSAENKAVLGAGGNSRREAQGGPGGQHGQNQGNGNPNPQNQGNGNPNNQNGYQHPSQGSGSGNATSSGPSSTSSVGSPTQSASTGAASSSAVNVNNLWPGNYTVWHPQAVNLAGSGQFSNAPSFYTMNGYIFGNNPTYEMCLSDKVIWYVTLPYFSRRSRQADTDESCTGTSTPTAARAMSSTCTATASSITASTNMP